MAEVEETNAPEQKFVLKRLTVNLTRLPLTKTVNLTKTKVESSPSSRNDTEHELESNSPSCRSRSSPVPRGSLTTGRSRFYASSPSSSSSLSPAQTSEVKDKKERIQTPETKTNSIPPPKKPVQVATIRREIAKKRPMSYGEYSRTTSKPIGNERGAASKGTDFFAPLPVKSSFRIPKKHQVPYVQNRYEKNSRRRDYDDRYGDKRRRDHSGNKRNDDRRSGSGRYYKGHSSSKPYDRSGTNLRRDLNEYDTNSCIQYVVGSVTEVEKWLNENPIGAKSNSAGEVPFVKPQKKVEPVVNYGRGLSRCSEDEPVPMSVDTEELVTGIQQFRGQMDRETDTICGQLTQLRSEMKEEAMSIDEVDVPVTSFQKRIYVVLDTNVLVSDLYTVDDIMKTRSGENDTFQVVLIVPWVVLQELDCIKDDRRNLNPKLKETACKAVRYLHAHFTNCHPQVKGQAVQEANEDGGLVIESNDDRILQCCLAYQKKGVGQVMLFSNDRNLCNKAIVSGLKAYTKETIKFELDKIDPLTGDIGKPQTQMQGAVFEKLLREFKNALVGVLEVILKHEMEAVYEDLWINVVLIKPPWTSISDLLKCFSKHWIAVFGMVVRRAAKVNLDMMIQKFRILKESNSYDHLNSLMKETLTFLSFFEPRQAYLSKLRISNGVIRNLLNQVRGVQHSLRTQQNQRKPHHQRTAFAAEEMAAVAPEEAPPVMMEEVVEEAPPLDPVVVVQKKFQSVWSSINHICGSLYDSFEIPNPIRYSRPSTLPSPVESFHFIPRFYPLITDIRDIIRRILQSSTDVGPQEEDFQKLCYKLEHYFAILNLDSESKIEEQLSPEMLHFFLEMEEKRELLGRGLDQLEECCAYVFRLILMTKDFADSDRIDFYGR